MTQRHVLAHPDRTGSFYSKIELSFDDRDYEHWAPVLKQIDILLENMARQLEKEKDKK